MLAQKAYLLGIDAIIVQDFGLAIFLIKNFPDLPIHASTQMTIHNLEHVQLLEKLGFKRAVLSRELSLEEIRFIKENSNIEIETFIHGALCISYSGQCLFSSIVGGRSGNRGKCAQSCRLPYELIQNNTKIDKGYLLSPRDLCCLELLPSLIDSGIDCFKIEGRMKSPEYVATVTRIYRKYIDLYYSNQNYKIDEEDKKDLLQVFNRGGFSYGHYNLQPNKNLIYKEKPNNMGIYIGNVSYFSPNKGHVKLQLNDNLEIGDTICFEHETGIYTVSELIQDGKNIPFANKKDFVEIGRMKGNISCGDKIFKLSSKSLFLKASETFSGKELKKIKLKAKIKIKKGLPITFIVEPKIQTYYNKKIKIEITSSCTPIPAINQPITKEKIIKQLSKTTNTPFVFDVIDIDLEDNLFISPICALNEIRRLALEKLEAEIIKDYQKNIIIPVPIKEKDTRIKTEKITSPTLSLLLNKIDKNQDYTKLEKVTKLYLPFSHFQENNLKPIIDYLCRHFPTYIYLPSITRNNFRNIILNQIKKIIGTYSIKGFVISNLGQMEFLKNFKTDYELIGNYTLNVFNTKTISDLNELGISTVTISPELNYDELKEITFSTNSNKELIVYGNLPIMTMNYCLFGESNKCYPNCLQHCKKNEYYLRDRLNFNFPILSDSMQTITTIFNSKITSITYENFNINSVRVDILNEDISEINKIIHTVQSGKRIEGNQYTSGNLNRIV